MAPLGGLAGGTGERVAREPLTGRVRRERVQVVGSGPVGESATPTPGQDPQPLAEMPRDLGDELDGVSLMFSEECEIDGEGVRWRRHGG